jgi:hypothetical protein
MFASHARRLIATLWVGSLWTVGYLAAPVLFATLTDTRLAGTIAGSLFRVEAWLSVFCAAMLAALIGFTGSTGKDTGLPQRKTLLFLIGAMLACTLVGYFGLQPFMAALRETAGPDGVMASDTRMQFGILHAISSGVYLVQSLLGVALILKMR